jgi:hypothetical protein
VKVDLLQCRCQARDFGRLTDASARMPRVLAYINRHLDGDLGLAAVSGVAALSKFHFHLSPY